MSDLSDEAAQIVVYLRAQADVWRGMDGDQKARDFAWGKWNGYADAADAIERGDHRP